MPKIQLCTEMLEHLINLVRQCNYIYNPSDKRHSDSYLTHCFWHGVSETLNVEEMDAKAWRLRWRNMRDSYVKQRRKGDATKGPYKFSNQMSFLEPYIIESSSKISMPYDVEYEEESLSEREDVKEEIRPSVGFLNDSHEVRATEASWSATPNEYVFHNEIRKAYKTSPSRSWNDYFVPQKRRSTETRPQYQDSDMLLFESYALRLKTLPKEAQAVIKMQMSQIFFNAENPTGDVVEILPSLRRNVPWNHRFQQNGETHSIESQTHSASS